MINTPIFSIGYGNRKPEFFLSLLQQFNIDLLVDIRTKPVSRFQPHYNKARLSEELAKSHIHYQFMGQELGGKPKDENLYVNGSLNYELVNNIPSYQNALQTLISLSKQGSRLCIMCCELKPDECHRKTLVGESLHKLGVEVNHINEKGEFVAHSPAIGLKLF